MEVVNFSRCQIITRYRHDSSGSVLGTSMMVVLVALIAAGATAYFLLPARHSSRMQPNRTVTTSTLPSGKTRKGQGPSQTPTTTSTSTPSTSSGTGVSTATTRCTASQMVADHTSPKIAAGTVGEAFTLKNVSSATCTIDGYPDIQLYDSSGNAMPTATTRNGAYAFTSSTPTLLTVSPGNVVSFNVGFSGVGQSGSNSCPSASRVSVALPQGNFHYPDMLTVNDSINPCNGGTLYVSAFYAGTPVL